MITSIHWRCYMRVSDQRKAERIVGRMQTVLGAPMAIEGYERYRKIPELAEVLLTSPLNQDSAGEALLTALEAAWRLARGWQIDNPDTRREFEGIAAATTGATFVVPGVEWMMFSITDDTAGAVFGPSEADQR
ncbi:hypothetical protein AB0M28_28405 [Streptomyces sp. NPDC051940]|uniref:hypothetical protein n=1 Tax=Streptomyces sp. NPDC051940 TaxID=3155675 RepID=UPI0034484E4B